MSSPVSASRRAIVLAGLSAAGGLMIGVPLVAQAEPQSGLPADGANPAPELSAFLIVEPDNTVTVRVPQQEMGQGIATGLAMLVAEELECDWAKVRFEYASANRNARAGGEALRQHGDGEFAGPPRFPVE